MTTYLQVQAGQHQLLLPIDAIIEVGDANGHGSAQHRVWRDRSLPVTDLVAFLGGGLGPARQQVVLGTAQGQVASEIVDVDRVVQLVDKSDAEFIEVAGISDALAGFVDGTCIGEDQRTLLLRLRTPFGWHTSCPVTLSGA